MVAWLFTRDGIAVAMRIVGSFVKMCTMFYGMS